jgi:hypothetical protein
MQKPGLGQKHIGQALSGLVILIGSLTLAEAEDHGPKHQQTGQVSRKIG